MPELQPIAVESEDGAVVRSGHGLPDEKIALVFHREPNSDGAFVVVGRAKNGSLPTGEQIGRVLAEAEGPGAVVESFYNSTDMTLVRGEGFDAISEWSPTYWGDCADVRTDMDDANP